MLINHEMLERALLSVCYFTEVKKKINKKFILVRKWCRGTESWGSYIQVHSTCVINKLWGCELHWHGYLRATFCSHDTKALVIHWNALIIASRLRQDEADGRLYLAWVLGSGTHCPGGAAGPIPNDLQLALHDRFVWGTFQKQEFG